MLRHWRQADAALRLSLGLADLNPRSCRYSVEMYRDFGVAVVALSEITLIPPALTLGSRTSFMWCGK